MYNGCKRIDDIKKEGGQKIRNALICIWKEFSKIIVEVYLLIRCRKKENW